MLTGMFKNFEELEESLTVEELLELARARSDVEYRGFRHAASLKGIDLDEEAAKADDSLPTFDKIKARAEARLAGKKEDELSDENLMLSKMGISVTKIEE
jgi:hypothetical protein